MPSGIALLGGAQALTTELRPVLGSTERGTSSPNIAQTLSDPAASDGVRAPNEAGRGGGAGTDASAGDPSRRNEQALAERRGAADARTGDFVRLSASGPQAAATPARRGGTLQTTDGLYQPGPRANARGQDDGAERVALSDVGGREARPARRQPTRVQFEPPPPGEATTERAPTRVIVDNQDVEQARRSTEAAAPPPAAEAQRPEPQAPTRRPPTEVIEPPTAQGPRRRASTEVVVDPEDVTRAATTRPEPQRAVAPDELGRAAPEDRPPTRVADAERPTSLRDVSEAAAPPTQVITPAEAQPTAGSARRAPDPNDSVEQAAARVTDPVERDRARAEEEAAAASARADEVRDEGVPSRSRETQAQDEEREVRRQERREQARVLERQRAEAEEAATERQRLREEARAASETRRRTLEQLLAEQAARREETQQTADQNTRFPSLRERQAAERAAS